MTAKCVTNSFDKYKHLTKQYQKKKVSFPNSPTKQANMNVFSPIENKQTQNSQANGTLYICIFQNIKHLLYFC